MGLLPFLTLVENAAIAYPVSNNDYAAARTVLTDHAGRDDYCGAKSSLTAVAVPEIPLQIIKLELVEFGDVLRAVDRPQFEQTLKIVKIDSLPFHPFGSRREGTVGVGHYNSFGLLLVAGFYDDVAVEEDETYTFGDFWFFLIGVEPAAPLHFFVGVGVYIRNQGLR